jgi:hypothetical protein
MIIIINIILRNITFYSKNRDCEFCSEALVSVVVITKKFSQNISKTYPCWWCYINFSVRVPSAGWTVDFFDPGPPFAVDVHIRKSATLIWFMRHRVPGHVLWLMNDRKKSFHWLYHSLAHALSFAFGRQFIPKVSLHSKPQASFFLLPFQAGDRRVNS